MSEFAIITVSNEDEIVSVEILEDDMIHVAENFYGALGYSVHIGIPEFDEELAALEALA